MNNQLIFRKRLYICLYLAISCIPALVILHFVRAYGVDTPFWDDWSLAHFFYVTHTSSLTFESLFGLHNEHRIVFPRLIMLGLIYLSSSWNVKLEMLLSYGIAVITFVLITVLAWGASSPKSLDSRSSKEIHLTGTLTIISSLLLFSTAQYENWLWGFQIAWFFIVLLLVSSVLLLVAFNKTGNLVYYVWGWLLCFIASFSSAHGLFTWIACSLMFLSNQAAMKKRKIILTAT